MFVQHNDIHDIIKGISDIFVPSLQKTGKNEQQEREREGEHFCIQHYFSLFLLFIVKKEFAKKCKTRDIVKSKQHLRLYGNLHLLHCSFSKNMLTISPSNS
jgi:hypothetical protein